MEHIPKEHFGYMIAGTYRGGKLPEVLQSVNTKIWQQWLPNSPYCIAGDPLIEWYEDADPQKPDYHSEIWIPIQEK